MKLIALKPFSYNSRRLTPGTPFEAKDPDGRLLIGVRKARLLEDRKEESVPKPNKDILNKLSTDGIASKPIAPFILGEQVQETIISLELAEKLKIPLESEETDKDKDDLPSETTLPKEDEPVEETKLPTPTNQRGRRKRN